ncbi:MAG: DUF4832 domain-containing protein [Clostridia bacterium]|nr:DUF4832 domain-containing protein [Clostridia bacterium]
MKKSIIAICLTVLIGIAAICAIIVFAVKCNDDDSSSKEESGEVLPPSTEDKEEEGGGLPPLSEWTRQGISYAEDTEKINNPDQGFYRPIYVKLTDGGAEWNKNIITQATQLYHLRVDISAYSSNGGGVDGELSDEALNGLGGILAALRADGKNAIVRFAYDAGYGGNKNFEPEISLILKHIEQVCMVLNGYANTVTAIETGLVGPWGEMHSSAIAKRETFNLIIERFLRMTDEIPVLVRTPKMIYDYLGVTVDTAQSVIIDKEDSEYRLGLFNDGYLGSDTDLGTYSDRESDIEFLCRQTEHLPYGGEVVVPNSSLHDIDKCLPEMFKLNLSYLNIEWHYDVINKWKNSTYTQECGNESLYYGKTAYNYIENRMGYRFLITDSRFYKADKLNINLKIENLGFGNMNKSKHAKLLFVKNGQITAEKAVADFSGQGELACSVEADFGEGEYEVYLCVYGEIFAESVNYTVQFANENVWNEELKANKIGTVIL